AARRRAVSVCHAWSPLTAAYSVAYAVRVLQEGIMWFEMRKEDLGFLDRAPVVHLAEAGVRATRAAVFAALVEAPGWKHWFPSLGAARSRSPPRRAVGTARGANLRGTHWMEEMIAGAEPVRWAWTVTRASVPLATAQVESFELTEAAGGTRVRWRLALEPRL